MTYATRTSYRSPRRHTRTRKIVEAEAGVCRLVRSRHHRLNVPEEIADLWLHRGVVAFFINPQSTPNLATLLHCTQISAINFPPLCRGASLATPGSLVRRSFASFLHRSSQPDLPLFLSSIYPPTFSTGSKRFQPRTKPHRRVLSPPRRHRRSMPATPSLQLHSPHCHWQTNLNGSIKSIRSNGT